MAARRGPTFRRRELGKELRRLRERKGYGTKEAAAAIESSEAKLNRVETGHNQLPRVRDLEDLLDFYGVTDIDDRDHLLMLHRESLSHDWYRPYQNFLPSGAALYAGLETDAATIRAWHSQVVFALLQTEDYARAIFTVAKPVDERTTEFVEENVALRMERKEVLCRDDPTELRVIIDEGALRHMIGSPEIMRDQYKEIERVAALDHVTVQILPQNLVTYRCWSNFVMLNFDAKLDPVVMLDGSLGPIVTDKPREVAAYTRRFDAMREGALAPVKTPEFLHRLAKEIDVD
ncbi:helix-turn-helix transcriptional regulator [Streptomyces sp. VNUA116]|uniref:helix-turn-helix domain-containing protein n=1 Tax=Streptomyces sp. VNUA116 TaxID=3062449 RepID=UPI0026763F70|nr:helix-turn-helix transcriptional regulator [Streptomyces sp. VNUA116]WKU45332.1 helix-turn-helix transcriptional regulator [Streptomyces sp. VNUA116]